MESVIDFEVKDFEQDVIRKSAEVPVVVDFWAEWCGPCKFLDPIIRKLASEANGKWKLVKVDTEANQELAAQWGIRGIPNVKLFSNGEVIAEMAGALPEHQLKQWIEEHLPTEAKTLLLDAKKDVEGGRESEAIEKLRKSIERDDSSEEAKMILARLLLFDHPKDSMELTAPFEAYQVEASNIHLLGKLLSGEVRLPDGSLKEKVSDAIESLKKRKFEETVALLIVSLIDDKHYADDLARRTLIAIFSYLGESHPVTQNNRRKFSMALY